MAKKQMLLLAVALAASAGAQGQNAIGEVYSGDASVRGLVRLSAHGAQVFSGSQVSASDGAAELRLKRGGEVRICPRTNLSVSSDASGKALALGLNVGSMELEYRLAEGAADVLMTPDFRLQLISPGTFHLAISVGAAGDTCVRTLTGDDAAVFVTELMGNGVFQLSPGKSVLFSGGKISGATTAPEVCGCPEKAAPIETRESAEATAGDSSPAQGAAEQPAAEQPAAKPAAAKPNSANADAAAPPVKQAGTAHLEVDSGFIYRGEDAAPDLYSSVSRLSLSTDDSKLALALLPQVSGPAPKAEAAKKKTGFLHRMGMALGHLFGR